VNRVRLSFTCCLSHTKQVAQPADPALSPGRGRLPDVLLGGCLPPMPSASGFPLLFGHFVGSTQPSDSPPACMLDFRLMAFSNRPATSTGADWVSRFSRVEFPCMTGVSDCAESAECSRCRLLRCCLPSRVTASALWSRLFRSSIPCLHVPLSTLRWQPYGWPRMTRGQDGSLCLSCVTLSFTTPRRFYPGARHGLLEWSRRQDVCDHSSG
jgi:hypothetical protein